MKRSTLETQAERDRLVRSVREYMAKVYCGKDVKSACLYWAFATIGFLKLEGVRAIIQAGTAWWPWPAGDENQENPYFGYTWNFRSPVTAIALATGSPVQMHAWVAIPSTDELIDLTTAFWPDRFQAATGRPWKGERPPDYLWAAEPPDGVIYEPDVAAIYVAGESLRRSVSRTLRLRRGPRLEVELPSIRV
jgi:hypothetical protein